MNKKRQSNNLVSNNARKIVCVSEISDYEALDNNILNQFLKTQELVSELYNSMGKKETGYFI